VASLPVEEQFRIYDGLDAARKRLNAPVETTADGAYWTRLPKP
jgi:hypothetical protein